MYLSTLFKNQFKNFLDRQIEFYRHNKITSIGLYLIGTACLLGLAAVNTGSNLLYLLFSMMVTLLVVNGVLALWMFKKLKIAMDFPPQIFARVPIFIDLVLINHKKILPSYSLVIEELKNPSSFREFIPHVGVRQSSHHRISHVFSKRGLFFFEGILLSCDFPFGFVQRKRKFTCPQKIVVFPNIHRESKLKQCLTHSSQSSLSEQTPGHGEDIFDIRASEPNEDGRHIHWKRSAVSGKLMSKKYETPIAPPLHLAWVAFKPKTHEPRWDQDFETALEEIASFVWQASEKKEPITIYIPGYQPMFIQNEASVGSFLSVLATLSPGLWDQLESWLQELPTLENIVFVVPRGAATAPFLNKKNIFEIPQ